MGNFASINPEEFQRTSEQEIYKSIILNHFSTCMRLGTEAYNRDGCLRFERAIKMLEAAVAHRISETYQQIVTDISKEGAAAFSKGDINGFYETLRLRFMIIVQELSFLGYMPEERAIDVLE